jgi:hypothetical protein
MTAKSWRDVLPIHPAAELFPLISSEADLRKMGEDIRKNGLKLPVVIWSPGTQTDKDQPVSLLDGRNRLDAMELVGIPIVKDGKLNFGRDGYLPWDERGVPRAILHLHELSESEDFPSGKKHIKPACDPYEYVISANIHRRHLTAEQKRELIGKLIKANPEKSDRQIAAMTKASPTTVGTKRTKMEAAGDVSKLDTRTDKVGRQQPARRSARKKEEPEPVAPVIVSLHAAGLTVAPPVIGTPSVSIAPGPRKSPKPDLHKFEPMTGPSEEVPVGSYEWAERISCRLQAFTEHVGTNTINLLLKTILSISGANPKPWEIWPKEKPYRTPNDYCRAVTGHSWDGLIGTLKEFGGDEVDVPCTDLATAKAALIAALRGKTHEQISELIVDVLEAVRVSYVCIYKEGEKRDEKRGNRAIELNIFGPPRRRRGRAGGESV